MRDSLSISREVHTSQDCDGHTRQGCAVAVGLLSRSVFPTPRLLLHVVLWFAPETLRKLARAANANLTRARHDGIVTLAWIGMVFNVTCAIHAHCVQQLRPCIAA